MPLPAILLPAKASPSAPVSYEFRTLQTQILPAGGRKCPARPREQPMIPLFCLEGSRRRIRLLSVHSHSHGGAVERTVKRVACKSPCAFSAQVCRTAGFFCRVFRLHGAVFLPFSGFFSPDSMFLSSYQNSFVFSSKNPQKARRLPCSSRTTEPDIFIKEAIARNAIGSACAPFLIRYDWCFYGACSILPTARFSLWRYILVAAT